jgi:hypothetical protein
MALPTACLALLALSSLLPLVAPTSQGLTSSLQSLQSLQSSLDKIDLALPLQDRHGKRGKRGKHGRHGKGKGSWEGGHSGKGKGKRGSGSSESGSAEPFTDALGQILNAVAADQNLLPILAAIGSLGSLPNPVTNPLDFASNPLVTALSQASTWPDASQAARDLAAALMAQVYGQPRLAQDSLNVVLD